ncbi:MAG: RNA polymerase sigma factor, partial [Gemmataceae bacterium]
YRSLADLRSPDAFAPWLAGICRTVVREGRRRPAAAPLPADLPDGRAGPDAERADEAAHLLALVARLPAEQAQAVRSFFLAGRDANEVARQLGRSRSGTYALLRDALTTLNRWMEVER